MPQGVLSAIFVIHAAAFAYFYVKRGRRVHNLLFFLGFVGLVLYYGQETLLSLHLLDERIGWLAYARMAGLGLCLVASPFFVAHLVHALRRRRRAR